MTTHCRRCDGVLLDWYEVECCASCWTAIGKGVGGFVVVCYLLGWLLG